MATLSPFLTSDAFNTTVLTEAINNFPIRYSKIMNMDVFQVRSITHRTAMIERNNGVLSLLPTRPEGAEPTVNLRGKRDLITVPVPHIPLVDAVLPDDVAGRRAFGSDSALMSLNAFLSQILEDMAAKHDITLEHLLVSALQGIVKDDDDSTIINYYTQWGTSQQTVPFILGTTTTDVVAKILTAKRLIEDAVAAGDTMSGIHVLCSTGFFSALVAHTLVKDAYKLWRDSEFLRTDNRSGFVIGGVTFEEYHGSAKDKNGTVRKFIADDEAIMFPVGTRNTFRLYFAPAMMNEWVNTPGQKRYAKQEEKKFGRGWDIWTEQNPLPVLLRPDAVVRLTVA